MIALSRRDLLKQGAGLTLAAKTGAHLQSRYSRVLDGTCTGNCCRRSPGRTSPALSALFLHSGAPVRPVRVRRVRGRHDLLDPRHNIRMGGGDVLLLAHIVAQVV
jgi:hypothetical protein